jgi:Uma2 family endonuclease
MRSSVRIRGLEAIDRAPSCAYHAPVSVLTLELPPQKTQTAFNLRRWADLLADRELARFEGRIETDRHGHIIMSPPPAPSHGSLQSEISHLLRTLLGEGRVLTECPISTADGVKAADVAWASPERMRELGDQVCFPRAPEVCVEVMSPGNTAAELREKMALYFDAGAREVWLCSEAGVMSFFGPKAAQPMRASRLCPRFPRQVELR